MLFTKITGAFAVLFAAVAAAPAPSSTSGDAIHASTLPEAQRLYERVYTDSLMGLLSNVSEAELVIASASPSSSAGRPRRVKPRFKRELVDEITALAVRQLLPPSINVTFDWPWEYRDWAEWQIAHTGDDIRPLKPNWTAPVVYTARPGEPLFNRTTCPWPLLDLVKKGPGIWNWSTCPPKPLSVPLPVDVNVTGTLIHGLGRWNQTSCPFDTSMPIKLGPGYLDWSTCPPKFHPLPWPIDLNATGREEPHRPILPRGELGATFAKDATPKDLRASILEQAKMAGFSSADINIVDKTIDDAQEIVYAAQIRATNVMRKQFGSTYRVTKRDWCFCTIFGCKNCPDRVKVAQGVQRDEADAIMEALGK